MNPERMFFWLIQRAKFKPTPDAQITGYDSLVDQDYMGAAEFEFGAVGEALRRVCADLTSYRQVPTDVVADDGRPLTLVCKPDQVDDINDFIKVNSIQNHEPRLKERTHLVRSLSSTDEFRSFNLWFDIRNDWFMVLGHDNPRRLMLALERLRDKWAAKT